MSESIDVLSVMRRDHLHADAYRATHAVDNDLFNDCTQESKLARTAVSELLEADRAVDAAEAALTRFEMAGPRHGGGPGTIWPTSTRC